MEPYEARKAEHRERVRAAGPEVAAIYLADKDAARPGGAYPDDAFVPELRVALARVRPAADAPG